MHKKIDFRIGSKSQRSLETRIGRLYNFSTLDYIKLIKKKCFVFVSKRPFRGEKLHNGNYLYLRDNLSVAPVIFVKLKTILVFIYQARTNT